MDKSFTAGSAAGHDPVQPVPTANVTSPPSPTHSPTLNFFVIESKQRLAALIDYVREGSLLLNTSGS
jgi:hypothetical protein